ncbi:hypothetical protein CR513_52893, partial [Mucuna pruriens]
MANNSSSEAYKQAPIRPSPIRANKKPIKIKYISSPVFVKAKDISEFRAMVQNLTGKDSGATTHTYRNRIEGKIQVPSHHTTIMRYEEEHKGLKVVHKTQKKRVKITYISSPVLVRACDASEFRSVVQNLTGKDSDNKVQDGKGSCHYNRSITSSSLEFDQDYFWIELARSVLPSPCLLISGSCAYIL